MNIAKGDARKGHPTRYSAKSLPYKKLVLKLAQFLTFDKRPVNIVNNLGFRNFCFAMNPAFTIPTHVYLSQVAVCLSCIRLFVPLLCDAIYCYYL